MVIGLLVIAAIPTVTGVAEAISSKKQQNAAMKEKIKFNMTATLSVDGGPPTEAWIVLYGGRMYIDHPAAPVPAHKFNGYYFKYPSEQGYQGLVSTISDDPPMLNWLYVDKDTGAIRYGSRKETVDHVVGPWGWSEDEKLLAIDEDDWRFIAVEEDLPLPKRPSAAAAAAATEGEGEGQGGGEDEDDEENEDDGPDVRYTHNWAPIRLLRKLQLGVDSSYVKGGGQSGNR
ncbi:hypothetical protein M406DRAFT_254826 [Cryphonectria parasitica EP155]|uniref:Uncharacterized protein n=1 Tax=Cryphonectria parasitica (strain ATCC 38755 / EP155) TaxID=660469 RepID=A0A9P5CRF5_CRYP1|nr:uncharacterized protein M406DRAFT_254826 [Cryphonectria parasitica EP155]KAF3767045.1 hypothetical protein M406DRAFT_254826 [Cryphonectria parasitica EP155]